MVQCLECGKELKSIQTNHLMACSKITKAEYVNKHPGALLDDGGTQKYAMTLIKQIEKYGEEEGKKRWDSYCKKQSHSNSFEYKQDKHGWSKDEYDSFNKSRATTKDGLVKKYGEEEGKKRWDSYCKKQSYAGCKLEYFIEKYGTEGESIWKRLNKAKGRSLEYFIKKYGDEDGVREYESVWNKTNFKNGSKTAKEFIQLIKSRFPNLKSYSHVDGKEFGKFDATNKRYYFYDLVFPDISLCIEFNGDVYHANPKKYKQNDIPKFRGNKKTALEIWNYDQQKQKLLTENGFDVIIVWEFDFLNYRTDTVDNICNLISQKQLMLK